jgi:hypothetical protein
LALAVLPMCHAGGIAGTGSVTNVSRGRYCWLWQCYNCVTWVISLAMAVLHMCHAGGIAGVWQYYTCVPRVVSLALAVLHMCPTGGIAGSGSVTHVSRGRYCWLWQCYTCVTRVVLLAFGSITHVSHGWYRWLWQCYQCVTRVVSLALAMLQTCHAGGEERGGSIIVCGLCVSGRDEVKTFGAKWELEMFSKLSQIATSSSDCSYVH